MRFEWDERKNTLNIKKHGMDFKDAAQMFTGIWPLFIDPDMREDYGEERWTGIGRIGVKVAVVVFTYVLSASTIRIISLRQALKDEQNDYYAKIL